MKNPDKINEYVFTRFFGHWPRNDFDLLIMFNFFEQEAMKHEWIQGKAAKVHLTLVKDNLEKTQAFKKWKKVLNTVRAFPPATTTSPVQGQQSSSAREPSSNNNSRSNDTPPVNNNQNNNNNNNAENSANKNK